MKKVALTALVALGVALPTITSAMTASESAIHSKDALKIFAQLNAESQENE